MKDNRILCHILCRKIIKLILIIYLVLFKYDYNFSIIDKYV